jgi:ATP-binding cassette subfamily B protein
MRTWQVLWQLIRYRPGLFLVNSFALTLFIVSLQVPGLVTRETFNELTGDATAGFTFWTLMAFLAASGLARMISFYLMVSSQISFRFTTAALLQKNILARILQRPGASAMTQSPGEAISRFRGDIQQLCEFPLWMNQLIGLGIFVIIALVVMARIDPLITVFVFVPLLLVVFGVRAATHQIEKYRKAAREATGNVTNFIGEIFGAVQAIQANTAEEDVVNRFRKLNDTRRDASLMDRLFIEMLHSVFRNAISLGTGLTLILAGRAMQDGTFTVGDFSLFVFYLHFVAEFTAVIGFLMGRYRQMGISVDRTTELLQGAPAEALVQHGPVYEKGSLPEVPFIPKADSDRLERLEAIGLTFRYPDSDKGIEGIDLRLERGSFTVITGRIGSGKTTLLRALLGLVASDGGEARWNDEPIADAASFLVPPRCAYTPQAPRLFSDSLRNNILFGLPEEEIDVEDAVRLAVMEKDLEEMELGLDTTVGAKGVKLSGGQIQRAAAARMFVRDSELLVFDDLSSALDLDTERALWERLFERKEATCLVVSHRHIALSRADHIIVMKDGRVEAEGDLESLLDDCDEMKKLWKGEVV